MPKDRKTNIGNLFGSDSNDSDSTYDFIQAAKITVARKLNKGKEKDSVPIKKDNSKRLKMSEKYKISITTKEYSTIQKKQKQTTVIESRKKTYNLRNWKQEISMTNNAISKKSKSKVRVNKGLLSKHRWTIQRNKWSPKQVNTVRKFLAQVEKNIDAYPYSLRGDLNRLLIPEDMLSKTCVEYSVSMTKSLHLHSLKDDNSQLKIGKTRAIITRPGATKQSFHYDTNTKNAYSVLHIISKRFIYIRDFQGEHYVEMKAGDILIMHDNCCHAGAELEYKRNSYALFVPVGFEPSNSTFPCNIE